MRERLAGLLAGLMALPGPPGHEDRVRRHLRDLLEGAGIAARSDRLGNLVATLSGDPAAPAVLLIAHMDQPALMVRRVEPDGFLRLERIGGVPERALPAQPLLLMIGEGRDLPAVIAHKSHHATAPEERGRVLPLAELYADAGFASAAAARAAGVDVGTPAVYAPRCDRLAGGRIAGPAIDDRGACAVLVEVARALARGAPHPTVHLLFSVQEEFNLRGALPAARALRPDICLQLDITVATDTPDLAGRGEVRLGAGPVASHLSFHGRGTLNGLLPHPALLRLAERAAAAAGIPLQRSAFTGALTETAYVQLEGEGVACLDLGFPCRSTHSAAELADLADLEGLARLVLAMLAEIGAGFTLDRDGVPP